MNTLNILLDIGVIIADIVWLIVANKLFKKLDTDE